MDSGGYIVAPMRNRREFLKESLAAIARGGPGCVLGLQLLSGCSEEKEPKAAPKGTRAQPTGIMPAGSREARFYRRLDNDAIRCEVCWRRCLVPPGKIGFCRNKRNVDGTYYSMVYGRPGALQIDPIEKEPSYHMLPGGTMFCTGTAGCNNRCKFCHNWHLSQRTLWEVPNLDRSPDEIVALAHREGCNAVSFTYNEPTVFYELMYDIAARARKTGLRALFHTNGGMNREPVLALLELMDAVTVDLKAFTEDFYRQVSSSRLKPVLRTLETVRKGGKHLEIVNLVIPTLKTTLKTSVACAPGSRPIWGMTSHCISLVSSLRTSCSGCLQPLWKLWRPRQQRAMPRGCNMCTSATCPAIGGTVPFARAASNPLSFVSTLR